MRQILGLLFLSVMYSMCKMDNSPPVLAESIQGKWMIDQAKRNNRDTKLLRNGYLKITDSTFSTNILKDTTSYSYSYDGKSLKVNDTHSSVYNVKSLTSDTLIIWLKHRRFEFKLTTVKDTTAL